MKLSIDRVLNPKTAGAPSLECWIVVDEDGKNPGVVIKVAGGGESVLVELDTGEARMVGELVSVCGACGSGGLPPVRKREKAIPLILNGGS